MQGTAYEKENEGWNYVRTCETDELIISMDVSSQLFEIKFSLFNQTRKNSEVSKMKWNSYKTFPFITDGCPSQRCENIFFP